MPAASIPTDDRRLARSSTTSERRSCRDREMFSSAADAPAPTAASAKAITPASASTPPSVHDSGPTRGVSARARDNDDSPNQTAVAATYTVSGLRGSITIRAIVRARAKAQR